MSEPPPLPAQDSVQPSEEAPKSCAQCGSIHLSTLTQLPVCEPCRMALVRFPFPMWVKAAAALVAVMVVVSLALSQERMQAALHFAHTKKLARQEHWEEAYEEYHGLMSTHSDTETVLEYAEAALNSGHAAEAERALNSVVNRPMTKRLEQRASTLIYQMNLARKQSAMPLAAPVTTPIRL